MSLGGFNFSGAKTTAPAAGGFTTSTPLASAAPAGGFGFKTPGTSQTAAPTATTGFSLTGQAPTAAPSTGFGFGTPAASTGVGLKLGTTPASTSATGFSLGGTPAATSTAAATPGFGLGITPATTKSVGFSLSGLASSATSTAAASTGTTPAFGFAKPLSVTGAASTASTGFSLGGIGGTTSSAAPTFGTLGGLGATASAAGASGASIFGTAVAQTASSGLGGVDPKVATSTKSSDASKAAGDGKTVKETMVENFILLDVDEFRNFVKGEKGEMEQMKRLSSTPMMKVQEDNTALRQLLSLVSSGLQRNTCAVEKLKREMTQELKNAEMAIRTKETPPGLQYENTAPMQYFCELIESFETQMLQYRQQIEMLETHLSSMLQPSRLTPDELALLLRKLHEAFIAMAAQLHQVHEAVKTQKEHYLSYRKVFHGDTRNIFERQKKAPVKPTPVHHSDLHGQPPFPGINNAAAVAMATALARSQQPQAGAPPVSGFSSFQPATGFGLSSTGFPSFGASTTQSSGFKGFGTGGLGGGLFGASSNLTTQPLGAIGTSTAATGASSLFSSPAAGGFAGGGTTLPQPGLAAAGTDQPFQLNKPPLGSKRGKR